MGGGRVLNLLEKQVQLISPGSGTPILPLDVPGDIGLIVGETGYSPG